MPFVPRQGDDRPPSCGLFTSDPEYIVTLPDGPAWRGENDMKTRAILSVLGEDRVGIVAGVSGVLADAGTNIEDIRQTILSGVFSMTMLVTVDEERTPFEDVQARLAQVATDLGMQITLQREDVFRYMHRI
jgi:ACT domain-containing protein